jgi:hypothetical protein
MPGDAVGAREDRHTTVRRRARARPPSQLGADVLPPSRRIPHSQLVGDSIVVRRESTETLLQQLDPPRCVERR